MNDENNKTPSFSDDGADNVSNKVSAKKTSATPGDKRRGYKISPERIKAAGILVAVVAVFVLFLMSPIFKIRTIEITGKSNADADTIISASKISKGDNIFSVDIAEAIEGIASLDRISGVTITRNLPSKIVIDVEEDTECAYIKVKKEYAGISPDGKVLVITAKAESEVPMVEGVQADSATTGQFIKFDAENAAAKSELLTRILTEAKNQDIIKFIKSIDITDIKDIHMTLTSDILVNLGEDGSEADNRIEYKIAYLKAIIPRMGSQQGGVIELADTNNVTSRATENNT